MSVSDAHGRTDLTFTRGGQTRAIRRDEAEFVLELDEQDRPVRVVLPGSGIPLRYEWDADGGCVVHAGDGAAILTLTNTGWVRRITLGDDAYLEEELAFGRVFLRAIAPQPAGASLSVMLRLQNMSAIAERRWSDGTVESFTRDSDGRLSTWTRGDAAGGWSYADGQLVADETGCRELDAAGRVTTLRRTDGSGVRYSYDACGRRVRRDDDGGRIEYAYDPLGALVRVTTPDGRTTQYIFDGIGRRVAVRTGETLRCEHRDEYGRLWSVTDAQGRALHTYIWIGDRIAARLDGPVGAPVAEAYLTDPFGTPLIALVADGEGWACERCGAPPFGHTRCAARPGLFGHFADPETGLIHCGARELDPELGLFLTPDPWHGAADDPRRWAGVDGSALRRLHEHPAAGFHDYAVCRFDPLGRADRDGHVSGGEVVLHIFRWMLLPTWGFPLTSIALFLFEPLNLYMEVVGLIILGFKALFCDDKSHPWGYNTIVKATGLLGSLRQFTFAFGLNGFLPRVISGGGPGGDRAVTVGNVIWINRDELGVLGRPEIIEVADIAGGAHKFNDDPSKLSVVALLASDSDGKQRIHGSVWTRGFGNAVRDRVPTGGGATVPSFADVAAGGGTAPGTLVLRQPVPNGVPVPRAANDREKLEVSEFVRGNADIPLGLMTGTQVWFALSVPKDTSFAKSDWVQVTAPSAPNPKPDPTYRIVRDILPADDHAAMILSRELPLRFSGAGLSTALRVIKVDVTGGAASSADWTSAPAGALTTLSRTVGAGATPADFPPDLAVDGILRIVAATGSPAPAIAGLPAGPAEDTSFATVKAVRAVLTLAPDAGGAAVGRNIWRRVPDGDVFAGVVEHAAASASIKLTNPSAAALPRSEASWTMLKEVIPSGPTPQSSPSR
jgi:YD repeat-containing protein